MTVHRGSNWNGKNIMVLVLDNLGMYNALEFTKGFTAVSNKLVGSSKAYEYAVP